MLWLLPTYDLLNWDGAPMGRRYHAILHPHVHAPDMTSPQFVLAPTEINFVLTRFHRLRLISGTQALSLAGKRRK